MCIDSQQSAQILVFHVDTVVVVSMICGIEDDLQRAILGELGLTCFIRRLSNVVKLRLDQRAEVSVSPSA
jgi:hypothetical protein